MPAMTNQSPHRSKMSGALILVVGPSGSGKDSLIGRAERSAQAQCTIYFPRRMITRQALASAEDHDTMTIEEFNQAYAEGAFALNWQAHGLSYGIRRDILDALAAGHRVIVNVSRGVIRAAEALGFPVIIGGRSCAVQSFWLSVSRHAGRQSKGDILSQLKRDAPIQYETAKYVEVRNETTLEEARARFIAAIQTLGVSADQPLARILNRALASSCLKRQMRSINPEKDASGVSLAVAITRATSCRSS